MLSRKRQLAARYADAFALVPGVRFVSEPSGTTSNYWLCTIEIDDSYDLDEVLAELHESGILCRPAWTPLADLPMFAGNPRGPLTMAQRLSRTLINLPSSAHLTPVGS